MVLAGFCRPASFIPALPALWDSYRLFIIATRGSGRSNFGYNAIQSIQGELFDTDLGKLWAEAYKCRALSQSPPTLEAPECLYAYAYERSQPVATGWGFAAVFRSHWSSEARKGKEYERCPALFEPSEDRN